MKVLLSLLVSLLLSNCAIAEGFDENYEVRVGDHNNDGIQDLYVRQKPQIVILHGEISIPIVLPTPVDDFILENKGNGTFDIIGDLSSSEKAVLENWPEATIQIFAGDFNLDGFFDLNLRNLSLVIPGAPDQIVFSNTVANTTPISVRAIDSEFQAYFDEVYEWVLDEFYLERKALANEWYSVEVGRTYTAWWYADYLRFWGFTLTSNGQTLVLPDEDPYDPSSPPNGCTWVSCQYDSLQEVWTLWVTAEERKLVYDYSHFNQDARNTVSLLDPILLDQEDKAGVSDILQIETILSSVLQATVIFPSPGQIVSAPGAIPVPGDREKPRAPRLPKLGWLGYLLYILDLAEWANGRVAENRMVFHYTTAIGRDAIAASGEIINPNTPVGGDVFFTYLAYPNSEIAMELLALCGEPRAGYFVVKQSNIPLLSLFTRVDSIDCEDGTHRNGGGWEATAPSPVSALPVRFIPIAGSF